ncbi:MAG: flavodoxin domain-containing protein [Pirellulaceae bacterium]
MNGAIFYSGKRGSTAQYAQWIGEATGLPVFDANDTQANPADYDFLILGASVIMMKMTIRKWVRAHWDSIKQKPTLLFSVSGVTADDPLLQDWLRASYPAELIERAPHFGLGGRLDLSKFNWLMRLFMRIGSYTKPTPEKKRDMQQGFDRVDKASIAPIVEWAVSHKEESAGRKGDATPLTV